MNKAAGLPPGGLDRSTAFVRQPSAMLPTAGENINKNEPAASPRKRRGSHTRLEAPRNVFLRLLELGYWPIGIYPAGIRLPKRDKLTEGKEPFGPEWGLVRWTEERWDAAAARYPGLGLGICLGPGRGPGNSWLVDVEGDGPEAEESRAKLYGGEIVPGLGWTSTRGAHQPLLADASRLIEILPSLQELELKGSSPGVYKSPEFPGLELRLGGFKGDKDRTIKQLQSVIPPTLATDGRPRRWTGGPQVAHAPDAFYLALAALQKPPQEAAVSKAASSPRRYIGGEAGSRSADDLWSRAAMADELDLLASKSPDSQDRNNQLNRSAFALGQIIGGGYLGRNEVETGLRQTAIRTGLSPAEVEATMRSGIEAGMAQPRRRPERPTEETNRPHLRVVDSRDEGSSGRPPADGGDDGGSFESLPHIICGFESPEEGLKSWTPRALAALAAKNSPRPFVFQQDKKLVRVNYSTDPGQPPSIERLNVDALKGILDRVACWANMQAVGRGVATRYGPPRLEIVRDVLALDCLDAEAFPPLDSIAVSPIFAPDGRLIAEPGYHRTARISYAPPPGMATLDVPESPDTGDVEAALRLIFDDLLCDFPFKDQPSKANALAVMLLPFARLMIAGSTPNHHFSSSTEGAGKGKCAWACAFPYLGGGPEISVQKESEAEWRKSITSFLMSGQSHFFIDNMYNPRAWDGDLLDVESGTLAALWTGGIWNDRILGGQPQARLKIGSVFMTSGNNVSFSRELTRRIVNIEIVAVSEDPSKGRAFKHDPLETWAEENRAALTRACLVLIQNWVAHGRPKGKATMGSYEEYARVMGGILEAAGVAGFLGNATKTGAGKDRETTRWPALVRAWHERHQCSQVSSSDLFELVFGGHGVLGQPDDPGTPELQIAFADVVGDKSPLSRKQKFGHAMLKQEGRVWAGWRIEKVATTPGGSPLFRLVDPAETEATLAG